MTVVPEMETLYAEEGKRRERKLGGETSKISEKAN
jgi:hypothetical protein